MNENRYNSCRDIFIKKQKCQLIVALEELSDIAMVCQIHPLRVINVQKHYDSHCKYLLRYKCCLQNHMVSSAVTVVVAVGPSVPATFSLR